MFDCRQNDFCGAGARCVHSSGQCSCGPENIGNGQQCFDNCADGNCSLIVNEEDKVDLTIHTQNQYFVFAKASDEL